MRNNGARLLYYKAALSPPGFGDAGSGEAASSSSSRSAERESERISFCFFVCGEFIIPGKPCHCYYHVLDARDATLPSLDVVALIHITMTLRRCVAVARIRYGARFYTPHYVRRRKDQKDAQETRTLPRVRPTCRRSILRQYRCSYPPSLAVMPAVVFWPSLHPVRRVHIRQGMQRRVRR